MSKERTRKLVIAVTTAESLILIAGLPGRLAEEGWQVHVVASGATGSAEEANRSVSVHSLSMRREPSPLADLRSLGRWIQLLRRIKPDVVFAGTPKAGLLGMAAGALTRVPVRVYHLRGLRLETTSGWSRTLLAALERLTLRLSTSTVAVSESLKTAVITEGLSSPGKMVVLGAGSSNGVDVERFTPGSADSELQAALGLEPLTPVIGFVGRLTRDKGGPELAAASEILAGRGISHQLLVVGPVEHEGAQRWFDSVSQSDVTVTFTGRVEDPELFYRMMAVFCLPTLREGFPNVVLEASASGIPVVTTDATGAIDSVLPGETGFIANAGDPVSLALALEEALSLQSDQRAAIGAAGRRLVMERYRRGDVQGLIAQYLVETQVQNTRERQG